MYYRTFIYPLLYWFVLSLVLKIKEENLEHSYVNSKADVPFMLAAWLFLSFNYNNKATMGLTSNMKLKL
jgi:hypothetical protein